MRLRYFPYRFWSCRQVLALSHESSSNRRRIRPLSKQLISGNQMAKKAVFAINDGRPHGVFSRTGNRRAR
jgi:hypothetical protein